jgi:membrane-associated phospholipid phosphatase
VTLDFPDSSQSSLSDGVWRFIMSALLAVFCLTFPGHLEAQDSNAADQPTVAVDSAVPKAERESRWQRAFWRIGPNTLQSFVGFETTPLHLTAVGMTALFAQRGIDRDIQGWAAGHDETVSNAWSTPGLIGGFAVPLLVPGLLLSSDDDERIDAGAMAFQAVSIALGSNILLKGITSREPPESGDAADPEDPRQFNFGFFRRTPFDGWPSGHMMTNMAMSAALSTYYHDKPWVPVVTYSWCAYIAASTTLGIQGGVHWASDVLAGGLIGWAIGYTVGKEFASRRASAQKRKVHRASNNQTTLIVPAIGRDRFQIVVKGTW